MITFCQTLKVLLEHNSTIAIADHQAITAAIPIEEKKTMGKQKFFIGT